MLQVVNASEQIEDILGYDDDHVTRPPDLEADVELADVPRYLGVPHFERNLCLWVPFEAKVAALYAVYTCYKLQIFERKAYIHLPYPILCELVSILPELQFQGIWDACEMLRALLKVLNLPMDSSVWSCILIIGQDHCVTIFFVS